MPLATYASDEEPSVEPLNVIDCWLTYHSETRRPGCTEESIKHAGCALLQRNIAAAVGRSAQCSACCDEATYAWSLPSLQAAT